MKKNKRALLVSSEPSARVGLGQFFGWLDFEIVQAISGAQAVEIYTEDPSYDLIVLDIDMLGMNGFTTAKMLRQYQIAKRPYVIGTSSVQSSDKDNSGKALQAGMDAYIVMPSIGKTPKPKAEPFSLIQGGRVDD